MQFDVPKSVIEQWLWAWYESAHLQYLYSAEEYIARKVREYNNDSQH